MLRIGTGTVDPRRAWWVLAVVIPACGDDGAGAGAGGQGGAASGTTSTTGTAQVSSSSAGGAGGAGGGDIEPRAIAYRVAVDESDVIYASVRVDGDADFFGAVPSEGPSRLAVAGFDVALERAWIQAFALDPPESPVFFRETDLVSVPGGGVVYAVTVGGALTVDGVTLAPVGDHDAVLVRLGPDGSVLWSKRLGGTYLTSVHSLAIAGDTLIATGTLAGVTDFGGGTLSGSSSEGATYLSGWALDDGGFRYARTFGGRALGERVAVVDASTIVLTGTLDPTALTLDGVDFPVTTDQKRVGLWIDTSTGNVASGRVLATGSFPGQLVQGYPFQPPNQRLRIVASDSGGVVDLDTFEGGAVVDGQALTAQAAESVTPADIYVASHEPGSAAAWLHHPVGTGRETAVSLCRSPSGTLAYTGRVLAGRVTLGSLEVGDVFAPDAHRFVAALDPVSGEVIGAMDLTSLETDRDCAFLSDERLVLAGAGTLAVVDLGL